MSDLVNLTTTDPHTLLAGDRIQAIGALLVALRVDRVNVDRGIAHVLLAGGNVVTLEQGTLVSFVRAA